MSTRLRKVLISVVVVLVVALLATWGVAGYYVAKLATAPTRRTIEDRDAIAGKKVENVEITTEDGIKLSAWYVPTGSDRVVLFLPGIHSCRTQFGSRAEFYIGLGYSVLMPDFRATGRSEGDVVSIGWNERKDLLACMNFLRSKGYPHIGVDGISMGAATICYSLKDVNDFAFIVLESGYDTMEHAINNRFVMFGVPPFLSYPMRWFGEWRIGARIAEMRPIDYMKYCKAPTLVMGGDSEPELKLQETQSLFDNCASPNKRICIFKGAHHENFLKRYEEQFKTTLRAFLDDVSATWTAAEKKAA